MVDEQLVRFTQEDVDKLRDYPELYGGLQRSQLARDWDNFVNDLADRIQRLVTTPADDSSSRR